MTTGDVKTAATRLMDILASPDSTDRDRSTAENELAQLGPDAVEPMLRRMEREDVSSRLLPSIFYALGQIKDPRAVEPLLALVPKFADRNETIVHLAFLIL